MLGSGLAMFYRMIFEGSRMRATPGKFLLDLKAVHPDGRTMLFAASALRGWPWWLTGAVAGIMPGAAPVAALLCLAALALIPASGRRQGLHDRMAGTRVVMRASREETGPGDE